MFNSEAELQRDTSLLVRAMCLGLMRTRDTSHLGRSTLRTEFVLDVV